jgi:hypothetical protein
MATDEPLSPLLDLDTQIRILISRHGADAVCDALAKATKKKRGRKPDNDWPLLAESMRLDAKDWLEGRDPFKLRTNYAVAKRFAEEHPGHSAVSTHARVERKLKEKRRWWMLVSAQQLARNEYPFGDYLRALDALSKLDQATQAWADLLGFGRIRLNAYRSTIGEPDPKMTVEAIEQALKDQHLRQMATSTLAATRKPFRASKGGVGLLGTR